MKHSIRLSFLVAVFLLSSIFVLSHDRRFASGQQIGYQDSPQQTELQTNQISNQDPFQAGVANDITVVRDSETILLKGQTIPAGDYLHLYDASPYKIINGHLATKIPCNA